MGINTHNFVKNDPKFENKCLFDANSMELDMIKFSDPKAQTFGVWDLKTSLEQFRPRAFGKELIKLLVENPSTNFHKHDLIFSRIMR